jgi:hypothetical protein
MAFLEAIENEEEADDWSLRRGRQAAFGLQS